jgi:hypothetical protein
VPKGSEFRYPTYDKELLAIVFAKEQFRHYLYGWKFTVVRDHEPLKHFNTSKHLDLRFNRLKAALRGYEFDIIYKKGKKNTNADALSRNPIIKEGQENPERPRAELYLLANKQEEEGQDLEKNVPPARIMLIEANRERKRKGKGSNSPRSDNPRARKIQSIKITDTEQSDSGLIISQARSNEKMAYLRKGKNIEEGVKNNQYTFGMPTKEKNNIRTAIK